VKLIQVDVNSLTTTIEKLETTLPATVHSEIQDVKDVVEMGFSTTVEQMNRKIDERFEQLLVQLSANMIITEGTTDSPVSYILCEPCC
jgi:hypothetical protein